MSLVTRAQAANQAVTNLATHGRGLFGRRERSAREAVRHFVDRALALPDNAGLPEVERAELTSLIEQTIQTIERYLTRPGEKSRARETTDQALTEAIYALKGAEERVSQRKHFLV